MLEKIIGTHVLAQIDQETIVEYSSTSTEDASSDLGFVSFFVGTILIPFSLALVWKNEKKLVNFVRTLGAARKECRSINIEGPTDEADYKLVHAAGNAINNDEVADKVFGATVENAYRLVRTVEMYQWKETQEKRERNGRTETTYWYESGWFSYPIDSSLFR